MKTTASIAAFIGLAAAQASYGNNCPAPGTTDSQGRYACNPAHQYPAGQICDAAEDGCPYLRQPGPGVSAPASTVSASTYPSASSAPKCAAPGERDGQGRYSCNPAHQYPAGQICDFAEDGCPVLRQPGPGVSAPANTSAPAAPTYGPKYTTEVHTAYTTYCPQPTTLTWQGKTTTVSKATTVTLQCPGGCTVTKPVVSVPTYAPSVTPSKPVETHPVAPPKETHPVVSVPTTAPVATPSVSVDIPEYRTPSASQPPAQPTYPAAPPKSPEQPKVYPQPSAGVPPVYQPKTNGTSPASPSKTQPAVYTGAATKLAGGAVGVAGFFAAFFL